jgi:5-formyltetrahydrofolate cyclo-ligase
VPGTALEPAGLGLSVPPAESPEVDPAMLLVPLLGFDRRGGRLGYGGGFYDRTLARLRAAGPVLAVGVGFAAQELPLVPRDRFDQRLDWLVTESFALKTEP